MNSPQSGEKKKKSKSKRKAEGEGLGATGEEMERETKNEPGKKKEKKEKRPSFLSLDEDDFDGDMSGIFLNPWRWGGDQGGGGKEDEGIWSVDQSYSSFDDDAGPNSRWPKQEVERREKKEKVGENDNAEFSSAMEMFDDRERNREGGERRKRGKEEIGTNSAMKEEEPEPPKNHISNRSLVNQSLEAEVTSLRREVDALRRANAELTLELEAKVTLRQEEREDGYGVVD